MRPNPIIWPGWSQIFSKRPNQVLNTICIHLIMSVGCVWIPHWLNEKNMAQQMSVCKSLKMCKENDPLLEDRWKIDSWYQCEVQMIIGKGNKPTQTTSKAGLYLKKVILSISWDCLLQFGCVLMKIRMIITTMMTTVTSWTN